MRTKFNRLPRTTSLLLRRSIRDMKVTRRQAALNLAGYHNPHMSQSAGAYLAWTQP